MSATYVVFFALLALASTSTISDEEIARIQKAHDVCQKNPATFITQETYDRMLKNELTESDKGFLAPHELCMNMELGVENKDGTLNDGELKKDAAKLSDDQSKVAEMVKNCADAAKVGAKGAKGVDARKEALILDDCFGKKFGLYGKIKY